MIGAAFFGRKKTPHFRRTIDCNFIVLIFPDLYHLYDLYDLLLMLPRGKRTVCMIWRISLSDDFRDLFRCLVLKLCQKIRLYGNL